MAIYTLILFMLPITLVACLIEGFLRLWDRIAEAVEWHKDRKEHYPRRKVCGWYERTVQNG